MAGGEVAGGAGASVVRYSKAPYFWIEGINSLAATYFFGGLMFLLHREYGVGDRNRLWIGAVHGAVYAVSSLFTGRIVQARGYFPGLRLGFIGMMVSIGIAWVLGGFWGHLAGLMLWTVLICFTWPTLEALVCEREGRRRLADRAGAYNVVWAGMGGVGYFVCRWGYEQLGPSSLYWVPISLHAIQWAWTYPLEARREAVLAVDPEPDLEGGHTESQRHSARFLRLTRLANPICYMAINTLIVVSPTVGQNAGLSPVGAAMAMSGWHFARTLSFLVLWQWHGWHHRYGWFLTSFILVGAGFVGLMLSRDLWSLLLMQALFGWGTALTYYSALFYAMHGSATHAEHGGIHEAIIGFGICGGPAVSALALSVVPGNPLAPAWIVGGFLAAGVAGVALAGNPRPTSR